MNRRDEIKARLKELAEYSEIDWGQKENRHLGIPLEWHEEAGMLLLELINDPEITEYFIKIERWYS